MESNAVFIDSLFVFKVLNKEFIVVNDPPVNEGIEVFMVVARVKT